MRDLGIVALLWVILSAIAQFILNAVISNWPAMLTYQGEVTADAIFILLRFAVTGVILVAVIIFYSAFRWRTKNSEDGDAETQYRHTPLFTAVWVIISVGLNVAFIIHPGITGLNALWSEQREAEAAGPLVVEVTAQQWEWAFDYPEQEVHEAGTLVLPLGRPAKFVMQSADVIHSFWVPAFGIKRDIFPEKETFLFITPTEHGSTEEDPTVRLQCAELCGVGHSTMRAPVRLVSEEEFHEWVEQNSGGHDEGGMEMDMDMGGDDMHMEEEDAHGEEEPQSGEGEHSDEEGHGDEDGHSDEDEHDEGGMDMSAVPHRTESSPLFAPAGEGGS